MEVNLYPLFILYSQHTNDPVRGGLGSQVTLST